MSGNDHSHLIILTSFEDEYEETHDPVWVWHAIDFCSNWQRKTGDMIPYPQWVHDYLSTAAETLLQVRDDREDLADQVAAVIGLGQHSVTKSVETIRDKIIYFEIQSAINHGSDTIGAIAEVARMFSLAEDTVKAIYRRFSR